MQLLMTLQPHTLQAEFWFIVLRMKLLLSGSGYLALVVGCGGESVQRQQEAGVPGLIDTTVQGPRFCLVEKICI